MNKDLKATLKAFVFFIKIMGWITYFSVSIGLLFFSTAYENIYFMILGFIILGIGTAYLNRKDFY